MHSAGELGGTLLFEACSEEARHTLHMHMHMHMRNAHAHVHVHVRRWAFAAFLRLVPDARRRLRQMTAMRTLNTLKIA